VTQTSAFVLAATCTALGWGRGIANPPLEGPAARSCLAVLDGLFFPLLMLDALLGLMWVYVITE